GRRRKMPDVINQLIQKNKLRHILFDELEIRIATKVCDVVHRSRNEIINGNDLVAAFQKKIHQMGTEKSGSTRDDRGGLFDFCRPLFVNRHYQANVERRAYNVELLSAEFAGRFVFSDSNARLGDSLCPGSD